MKRVTSLFAQVLPAVAALSLVAAPVLAQSTPLPSSPTAVVSPLAPVNLPTPGALMQPTVQPGQRPTATTPAPPGQGQQPGQSTQAAQGQATTPPAAAPRPETPRAPNLGGPNNQPMSPATNIRLDLTITDTYTGAPVKKTVSLLVLNANSGMIRTNGSDGWSVLNVDAVAAAYTSGQVSLRMTFEYTPAQAKQESGGGRAPRLNESITVVLQDGKPLMVSQSADPATDRKVTAELTATILK